MNKRSQQILAFALIALGGLYIVANLLDIDPSNIFWPIVLILLGFVFIFRPKEIAPANAKVFFAGDRNYGQDWTPQDEDLRMFAGDVFIDLGKIELPAGTTSFAVRCFATDIDIILPADVGLKIGSTGFVVETKFDGDSVSNVMTGYDYKSENYDTAEKKFDLYTTSFAVDISIRTI
jgi:predicted membrane protein